MSLSRFTRGLISSHISARSAPLWDQIEVAMMEPATGQERKNARPGSLPAVPAAATTATNTTATRPTAYVKDGKGRSGAPQPAAMAPRAARRRARREARAPHTTATMDESGLGGAPPEAEQPVYASWAERRRAGARPGSMAALVANGREAVGAAPGRMTARRAQADTVDSDAGTLVYDNSASADAQETRGGPTFASWAERRAALGGARVSPIPPPDAASASAARASPAGPSAPSPRETDNERPLWEWQETFADLEGLPSPADVAAVALDVGAEPVESDTPRGRALESDTPWPPRAPRRERPRRRTAQAERAAAKSSAAQGSSKRPENTSAAPQGQWSVARDPNIRVDATCVRVLRVRDRVRAHVERAVQRVFGSHYTVEFFGSTRYGVSHAYSDLDMVIIDPYRPQGYLEKEVKDPLYNVRTLATALRRDGFIHVDFRMHSSVPIVKFKDAGTGLDCDLNVNERLGILNSDMIKEYCALSPMLRPLLFRIKEWAKPLGLNMPTGALGVPASFSSYALALMTIAFLQERRILPNLQHNLPPLEPSDSETLVWTRKPHQGWDARFGRDQQPRRQPNMDEQTLLRDWFRHWETFPYDTTAAAIRHGGMLHRRSPLLAEVPAKKPPSPVVVVDPFILSKNVAIGVAARVLVRFQAECGEAAERMAPKTAP